MSEDRNTAGEELPELEPDEPEDDFDEPLEAEDADEPGEPAEEEPERTGERAPQRRPGRREREAAERRRLREEVAETKRELQTLRTQTQQRQPQVDYAEQARVQAYERDQLPLLPIDQQIGYWRQRDQREIAQALLSERHQTHERLDRASWEAAARADPRRARFADRVEARLAAERQNGQAFPRETIYKFLLGEEMDRRASQQTPRQRAAAARRVAGQQARPAGSRSDAPRERGREDPNSIEAIRARVRGRPLW